jgi:hypothetical protein
MIKTIIELLNSDKFYGVSERVDVAKGIHVYPNTWKETFKQMKRYLWRLKR